MDVYVLAVLYVVLKYHAQSANVITVSAVQNVVHSLVNAALNVMHSLVYAVQYVI